MADYTMSFDQLGLWMSERTKSPTLRHPQATSLSMLDGPAAAFVAGPVSMMPEDWVCPLLGVDPDDFNHDTQTFSAIAATLMRHNAIVKTLSTKPETFKPLLLSGDDGQTEARPWRLGFYAVMKLHWLAWSRLLSPNASEHAPLLPILVHRPDPAGRPVLNARRRGAGTQTSSRDAWRDIPAAVEALRQFWIPTRFKRGA